MKPILSDLNFELFGSNTSAHYPYAGGFLIILVTVFVIFPKYWPRVVLDSPWTVHLDFRADHRTVLRLRPYNLRVAYGIILKMAVPYKSF
jgi:hypothetical protein